MEQIEKICKSGVSALILREKDLSSDKYTELASGVLNICKKHKTPCILHSFISSAIELGVKKIHLPIVLFRTLTEDEKSYFEEIGTSVHSLEEAREACRLEASYLIAGHIYDTDCKKGTPARGISFLKEIIEIVNIPVYAIGGIDESKFEELEYAGCSGACRMSHYSKIK